MSWSPTGGTWSTAASPSRPGTSARSRSAGELTDADRALLEGSKQAFAAVGESLSRSRFKAAITEVMRTLGEANKYLSDQAPWKLRESDPERMRTILHVALQLVDDGKTLMTPFLPRSSQRVYEMLGGDGSWSDMPRIDEVDEDGGPAYPVITGDYSGAATWGRPRSGRNAARGADAAVRQDRPRRRRWTN